jgi:two-component system chemotaxis response regulator CheB
MPAILVSSASKQHALQTLLALEHGAVDFVTKPSVIGDEVLENFGTLLHEKIVIAITAGLKLRKREPVATSVKPQIQPRIASNYRDVVIAIGASTGGAEALKEILLHLPSDSPPVVVAQHMPAIFTSLFAKRLDELCAVRVTESVGEEVLNPGHVFIAPGGFHLSIRRASNGLETHIDKTEPVNRHRPSVDVLFYSVALHAGSLAIGVLLTGMGRDGADGLGAMRKAGAFTIAQDEGSSVVFGMPKAAIDAGYANCVASVERIASYILQAAQEEPHR